MNEWRRRNKKRKGDTRQQDATKERIREAISKIRKRREEIKGRRRNERKGRNVTGKEEE